VTGATGGPSDAWGRGAGDGRDGRDSIFDGTQDLAAGFEGPEYDDWEAEEAELSQLVRPYTLTRGRTRPAEGSAFDVIAQVVAVDRTGLPEPDGADGADDPEHQAILLLVLERPLSVAEVAADTDLPLGVVRILLGDLVDAELIRVARPVQTAELPDTRVLREVIRGLRAL
jgi:hypothetical protein